MAMRLSALLAGHPSITSREILGTHFCQRLSGPQGCNAAERIGSTKNAKPNARGYNWATLFLGEINAGTWPSRLRESQK
jgi:hypothetical protein